MNKQLDIVFLYLDTPDRRFDGFTYCTGTAKIISKLIAHDLGEFMRPLLRSVPTT